VGSISGLIYLDLDLHFANRCAARLLGMSSAEIDAAGEETVNDAIGELTNMTLGAFKNQLCDRGFPCKLTIPSVIRGQQFVATPVMGATRRTYHFELNGHRVVADILIGQAD